MRKLYEISVDGKKRLDMWAEKESQAVERGRHYWPKGHVTVKVVPGKKDPVGKPKKNI